jgi:hypothetical protein
VSNVRTKDSEGNFPMQSSAYTAGKFKLWKYDYYRDKDTEAMNDIAKELWKYRTKIKPNATKPNSKPISKPQSGVSRSKGRTPAKN